jgi:hypothetical protein
MAKKKSKPKVKEAKPDGSKIIEQCVIYLQSKAAFKAGFDADTTGDSDFAGCGKGAPGARHFKKADKALRKLVCLSPADRSGAQPLTTDEIKSKATVCRVMEWEADTELTKDERTYVRFFAREVEDYLAAQLEQPE